MKRVTLSFFVILALIGVNTLYSPDAAPSVAVVTVQTTSPAEDSVSAFLQRFDEQLLAEVQKRGLPGGAYVITIGDSVVLQKGFGVRKAGSPELIDEHTVFRLGSVSKGFAAVLTGIMVEQGLVQWEDTVAHILPYFALNDTAQTERVQVYHLLSHTTGLPRHAYTNLVEDGLSLERIIPKFKTVPLIGPEGSQLAYTNAAFAVIEKVLEAKTGTQYSTLLHEEIFEPLGMSRTSTSFSELQKEPNKAHPHFFKSAGTPVSIPIKNNYYNAVSAGGINASVADMGKWLLLLTGNHPEIISDQSLDRIFEPISTINNRRFSRHWPGVNRTFYGMGWRVLYNGDQTIIFHGGYVNGYRSEIAFDRERKLGICILFNSTSGYALEVIPQFFNEFARIDSLLPPQSAKALVTPNSE